MQQKILVLGASGMLGSAVFKFLSSSPNYKTYGTVRANCAPDFFSLELQDYIECGVEVENFDSVVDVLNRVKPDVVINCIGLVKQLSGVNDVLMTLPLNAMLPHRLARLCELINARLIHISTDCVFLGVKGSYTEEDIPDAQDLYGRSKLIGEVNYQNAITLRTSIIGHELNSSRGLIEWFLTQNTQVNGFTRAVFSGFPTCELARIIGEYVIPNQNLQGVYHVSSNPITKYELLTLVSEIYHHRIEIVPDDQLVIDRSLDSSRFRNAAGYLPPSWPELINRMYLFG